MMTNKQRKFIKHYLESLNATQAALEAGYSKKTAHQIGYENLKKPEIQKEILNWKDANLTDLKVLKMRVTQKLLNMALRSPKSLTGEANQLRAIELLLKYSESLPTSDIKPKESSRIARLLENAKLYEARSSTKSG